MVKLIKEGKAIMFCTNCGNKLAENACVCVYCGVLVKNRSENKGVKRKKRTNAKTLGIVSSILAVISLLFSLMLFFHDISSVGMYTEVYERAIYAFDYSLTAIMLSTVSLIFSLIERKNMYSKIGLIISLLSFFFIITEFIVVIIY